MTTIFKDFKDIEPDITNFHPLVSWRSVLAGLLVTTLAMIGLVALGMAFGGVGLGDGSTWQNASIFTGVWFLASAILSLMAGSYFAARVSRFQTTRVGSAQGLVIAALFFSFLMWQTLSALSSAGQAVGSAASAAGQGLSQLAQNPTVNHAVEDTLGDLNIPPERVQTVVTGVATRLMQGNAQSAQNYLARQTGITPEEANTRMAALRAQVDQTMIAAREKTASALKGTGWTLFLMIVLGTIAATVGGALGSRSNVRKPLASEHFSSSSEFRPATI